MRSFVRVLAACAVLAAGTLPAAAAEGSASVERILSVAETYGAVSDSGADALRQACGEDPLCVARNIVAAGGRARLLQVSHPDSDTIRWVTTEPAVTGARWLSNGARLVMLDGFGRKVVSELREALKDKKPSEPLVLDLRGNGGGDLGRMLQVAALFMPKTKNAIYLIDGDAKKELDVAPAEGEDGLVRGGLVVLVGPGTASSGEILAALLRRHAGARLLGEPTAGKDFLYRVVPVDNDWLLLLPAEAVVVPGETIASGLQPDGEISSTLAAEAER